MLLLCLVVLFCVGCLEGRRNVLSPSPPPLKTPAKKHVSFDEDNLVTLMEKMADDPRKLDKLERIAGNFINEIESESKSSSDSDSARTGVKDVEQMVKTMKRELSRQKKTGKTAKNSKNVVSMAKGDLGHRISKKPLRGILKNANSGLQKPSKVRIRGELKPSARAEPEQLEKSPKKKRKIPFPKQKIKHLIKKQVKSCMKSYLKARNMHEMRHMAA